jgi:hypothetical protein
MVLLDKRKPAELQWLQNSSQMNGDNVDKIDVKLLELRNEKVVSER